MEKQQKKPPRKSKLERIRIGWAREHKEEFESAVREACAKNGISVSDEQLENACNMAIEDHAFGFPAEYKLADMFAEKEKWQEVFADMQTVMHDLRVKYYTIRTGLSDK